MYTLEKENVDYVVRIIGLSPYLFFDTSKCPIEVRPEGDNMLITATESSDWNEDASGMFIKDRGLYLLHYPLMELSASLYPILDGLDNVAKEELERFIEDPTSILYINIFDFAMLDKFGNINTKLGGKSMIGYKGFDKDFKCKDFQYEVGKTYELEGELKLCENGFHFCTDPNDVAWHYPIIISRLGHVFTENRYALVEALGDIVQGKDIGMRDSKCATNKIRIVREISKEDYLALCRAFEAKETRARL